MKRYLVVLNVILCFLVSCAREVMDRQPVDGTLFYAGIEDSPDGKTFLSNHNIYWQTGDEIAVFGNGVKGKFTLVEGAMTSKGTFSGNVGQADEYFAVYPYSESVSVSSSTITTEIPQIQPFLVNSVGSGQNVAVAYSNNNTLTFKNVSALLKFEITSPNIGQIIITGNNNENLAGKVDITFSDNVPVCTVTEGKPSVILQSGAKPFDPGVYYAAVLPQTFTKGIKITMKPFVWTTDNVVLKSNVAVDFVKSSSTALTAGRSTITNLRNIDKDAVWKYAKLKVNCLRWTGNDYGQYIDFNTGRTFSALGSYPYCKEIDLAFMKANTGGAGFCSISSAETSSITNATNLGRYGTPTENDYTGKWANRNTTRLCYLPSMTQNIYNTITTRQQLEELFEKCTPVTEYFAQADAGVNLNNSRIQDGSQKFCIFKTGEPEGSSVIGLIMFGGVDGNAWTIEMYYKYAYIPGAPGPEIDPVQPVDSKTLTNPIGINAIPASGEEKPYGQTITTNLSKLDVRWMRSPLNWGWINSTWGGSWNYTYIDNLIKYAKSDGINVLPILCFDQEWARPLVGETNITYWLDYVSRLVNRYKDYCHCWEVYNEPNHKSYWHGENPNPEHYTELLKRTYQCIKGIDPCAAVIFGGIAGVGKDYIESCLKAGAGDYFDVMNFHPYNIQGKPEKVTSDIKTIKDLLAKYGCENKPLWITEIGWTAPNIATTDINCVSEQTQAEYLTRMYLESFAAGVNRTFWYRYLALEDKPADDPDMYRSHYGIVHRDDNLTPKLANNALAALTAKFPSGSTRPVITTVDSNIYVCHWQNPEGKNVWAFWSGSTDTSASLSYTGTLESAADLYGGSISLSAGTVQVKTACTYVIGPESLTIN